MYCNTHCICFLHHSEPVQSVVNWAICILQYENGEYLVRLLEVAGGCVGSISKKSTSNQAGLYLDHLFHFVGYGTGHKDLLYHGLGVDE